MKLMPTLELCHGPIAAIRHNLEANRARNRCSSSSCYFRSSITIIHKIWILQPHITPITQNPNPNLYNNYN
ncbi:hypothetical protein Hanom_Chr07g00644621 [Helianthus anomalus]